MVQVLVQLPDEMAQRLEEVAPASGRQRSRFIRLAIQKALMDLEDEATRRAYLAQPDAEQAGVDASTWDEWKPKPRRRARRS